MTNAPGTSNSASIRPLFTTQYLFSSSHDEMEHHLLHVMCAIHRAVIAASSAPNMPFATFDATVTLFMSWFAICMNVIITVEIWMRQRSKLILVQMCSSDSRCYRQLFYYSRLSLAPLLIVPSIYFFAMNDKSRQTKTAIAYKTSK